MNFSALVAVAVVAALEGALVVLPRADAFSGLRRIRSPLWAGVLPAMIVVGTFGVLALQPMAFDLLVLAAVATPILAAVAVLAVVRVPRLMFGHRRLLMLLIVVVLAVTAVLTTGWAAQLASTVLTALGSLAVGIAITRLIPRRWIALGMVAMGLADLALLASGVGEPAAALMSHAAAQFHGPAFEHARIGPVSTDYPDLVLASVLGGIVAADASVRRRACAVLSGLCALYGLLFAFVAMLPATLPIVVTYALVSPRTA